jgi:hypothetical protein
MLEPHDLLKGLDKQKTASDIARQNYVLARVGDTVDLVTRQMPAANAEHVIVVERDGDNRRIGTTRAVDILSLRRWVMEEEDLLAGKSGTRT